MTSRRFAIIAAGLERNGHARRLCHCRALSICPTQRVPTYRQLMSRRSRRRSAFAPMTAIAEASLQESSQPEAPPLAEIAAVSTPDFVHSDAKEPVNSAETLEGIIA